MNKGGRMANNRERLMCVGLKKGPDLKTIQTALKQALDGDPMPTIPIFGNGYRGYPIEITGVEIVQGSKNGLIVNLFGQTNYRDMPAKVPCTKVIVRNYSPYCRVADGIVLLAT